MKKLLPLVFFFICCYAYGQNTGTYPQENKKAISIGIENMLTRKSPFVSYGFGASLKGEYPLGESLSAIIGGGYNRFFVKDAYKNPEGTTPLATFIPVKAGARYFIGGGVYTDGELGATIETNYEKKKYFNLAVGIGYVLPLHGHSSLDMALRYEDWGNQTIKFAGLCVAYRVDWL